MNPFPPRLHTSPLVAEVHENGGMFHVCPYANEFDPPQQPGSPTSPMTLVGPLAARVKRRYVGSAAVARQLRPAVGRRVDRRAAGRRVDARRRCRTA
ncbi:MAG: hypothetical protein WDM94_12825 [Bauldia sp.]